MYIEEPGHYKAMEFGQSAFPYSSCHITSVKLGHFVSCEFINY